ncbi:NADPH:quinone oxidoreductase family protein [Deinococcus soli (ex Cha et al. 2016)]|uniref:NADPH2:quinone reductase n=2 Tax=Deinococcus soli (ex Cha et al. 2016) TaxID=1309411 RepID=A0ACC6KET8_9DEIO|nr:NADPH:quinone oxidoreductase family protein [Deinococcus soli (ex Cha et al. 2016)]MDR6217970.1 NADPH2:quinone reductase [Deinococcus soli (ex Cha et al. 2016)]MDR6328220.1 NADPH2:quinone reductase [Deinococcus soli (ex Cha et al. 2016)]MDR6751072.1 NADPH2:quinone reductase [Deinococcus soli (ex Cha et al. 2016)]
MRALTCTAFDEPETLTVTEQPTPGPGPGEVLIRVHAASVNYPDALMVQGKYQVRPPLPFTPGAEAAGTVETVGEGVTHLKVGQRVAAFTGTGAFATHLIAPAAATLPIPDDLDLNVAATLPLAYGTAMHALIDRGQLKAGETLLVLGAAGGVGLAAVMIGKALGARVIAAASTQEKLDLARAHGADEVINYTDSDLKAAVGELTGKKGVDVILDPVGDRWAESAFRAIAWGGRYLVIGFAGGEIPKLPLNLPLLKGASIVGVFWGEYARRDPRGNARHLIQLADWVQSGTLKPEISRAYTLQEAPQAMRDLLERRVTGKVIVTP